MRKVELTQGKFALVDDEDFEWISQWKWHFTIKGYAARNSEFRNGTKIFMHRVINNTPQEMETDHINRDRLDNRRKNLRTATHSDNMANRGLFKTNTSGYTGVYKNGKKWQAQIVVNERKVSLGCYLTPQEASRVFLEEKEALYGG